jgi:hypothetical protein
VSPAVEPPEPEIDEAAVTVVVAEADLVESRAEAAVMVTEAGDGTLAGAVYAPPAEIVPSEALPPATPSTLQVTAVLAALATVAVNVCVAPTVMLTNTGVIEIDTGGLIVTCAVAYLVVSDVHTAITVTTFGDGTDAGGV